MAKIKICGLKRPEDIAAVNLCLPDYIGFVFAKSKRQVDIEAAAALKACLDFRIQAVGVFVNEDIGVIAHIGQQGIIDAIQLHGDEDESYIEQLRTKTPLPVIKAVAVGQELVIPESGADYVLFDTYKKEERGGTGQCFNWQTIKDYDRPYFLAGGLTSTNIASAISMLNPYCLDVSSGAETDGIKDRQKILDIVTIIRGVGL